MQTFLPYADFALSVAVLDNRRLGKQRIEAWQLLMALLKLGKDLQPELKPHGYRNHPATLQWRGHEYHLWRYLVLTCDEWAFRGFSNLVMAQNLRSLEESRIMLRYRNQPLPPWLGMRRYHLSHRSSLLRKQPDFYRKRWPKLPSTIPYYWPSHHAALKIGVE